jgi:hypothetical protein
MFTFFVRGFAFLSDLALEAKKETRPDDWMAYQKKIHYDQEIQTIKDRVFLQQHVW